MVMGREARVFALERAVARAWRDVGPNNEDRCFYCEATIDAETQDNADDAGWDAIEHEDSCPVLLLHPDRR